MVLRRYAQTPQRRRRRRKMLHGHSKTTATPEGLLSQTGIHHHDHTTWTRHTDSSLTVCNFKLHLVSIYYYSMLLTCACVYMCMFYHCYIVANLSSVIGTLCCFVICSYLLVWCSTCCTLSVYLFSFSKCNVSVMICHCFCALIKKCLLCISLISSHG